MHKNHQDPIELDLTKPRLASYKQKWKCAPRYGVLGRFSACSTIKIEVLSNKMYAIILHDTLPAYRISKVVVMEFGENHIPESRCVTSTTTDDCLLR